MAIVQTTLATFPQINPPPPPPTNGIGPRGSLIADANGDLFGTTQFGGTNNEGTVFELAKNGTGYTLSTLVSFTGTTATDFGGFQPYGDLIDINGDLYGTTSGGGPGGYGTVFKIEKGASTPTTLASFNLTDGNAPIGSLIADGNGDLFGTTEGGGTNFGGTVFELAKNGAGYTLSTLVNFGAGTNPPSGMRGSLILDASGDLFGTTQFGGTNGQGTVFEIVKGASTPTILASFNLANGSAPYGSLIADANGDLFGTTSGGGANGDGTVFELANNGGSYTLSTLVSFHGTDGNSPQGSLIADANGDLFGTTAGDLANTDGTVFEIVKTGPTSYASTPITLFTFNTNGADGSTPLGSLLADASGDLFGTTEGSNGPGTVFELSPSPPGLSVAATASYASLGPATMLSPNVTVGDAGSPTLASARVTITGVLNTGDTLSAITAGTSITASYNASKGVLTLTGTDTLAHYASVLRSVSFSSSNQNPTNSGSDINRTVTWVVDDGSGYASISAPATTVLNIISSNPPPPINPPPPAGTTALMIMTNPSNGNYEIYDVGGNGIQAAYAVGQVGSPWTFAGLGTFQAGDTSDMLLRNSSTGAFQAYYISNNNITGSASVGTVGLDWNFSGIGNFDGTSNTINLSELLLRNAGSGSFELYHVAGGGVLSGSSVAPVGNNFQEKGFGFFSENNTTQMLMQDNSGDAANGQLELYTYQPSTASLAGINVGKVGSNLSIVGCADLLGNGETQMVMQQDNGNFWLYTYSASTNSLSGQLVGAIGSNFHVVGFGSLGTAGQDEMLMQDAAGNFEVYQYNANLNAFVGNSMGAVGAPWVVDGIAADPPSGVGTSTAQLVQAMAGFGGGSGAADGLNAAPLGADTSQQQLLTMPNHT